MEIAEAPRLTLWMIAEMWAKETGLSIMIVVDRIRIASTCPDPKLIVWPTAFFNSKGKMDEFSVATATRSTDQGRGSGKYWTAEHIAAREFLNSSYLPPEPTDSVKNHLSQFACTREDFQRWCNEDGHPLPRFWFPEEVLDNSASPVKQADEYAAELIREGMKKERIAYRLKIRFNLQYHQIARLAAPNMTYTEAQERAGNPRKNGHAWVKRGEQMEKMTSS